MKYYLLLLLALGARPQWNHVVDKNGHSIYYTVNPNGPNGPSTYKLTVAEEGDSATKDLIVVCDTWKYLYPDIYNDNGSSYNIPAPGSLEDTVMLKVCPKDK